MIDNEKIDLHIIRKIHRWDDGVVGFVRKNSRGEFQNVGAFPISELQSYFPQLRGWIVYNSYFTINSAYRTAPYKEKTGFPGVWRKENQLKYLNALYVDLDVGRNDSRDPIRQKSWRYAIYKASELMDQGIIPQASIIANSGRGVYLLWVLHSKDNDTIPEKAFSNRIALYKQINREMVERLKSLAADPAAIDAARVLRVPGSIHSGTDKQVKYLVQLNDRGEGFSYSLDELAHFLGIKITGKELPQEKRFDFESYGRKTKNKGSCPRRINGLRALNRKRIEDLLTLEQYRGGIDQGFRFSVLYLYCDFLNAAGYSKTEMQKAVEGMASRCNPPYPSDKSDTSVDKIIHNSKLKPRKHSNKKLCRLLGITNELAESLNLITIIPPEVKIKRKEEQGETLRERNKKTRLEALRHLTGVYGFNYGCRKFERALKEVGINCNRTTINRELKLIELEKKEPLRRAA